MIVMQLKERLKELRIEYKEARENEDSIRMSQLIYMAESLKSGNHNFLHDNDRLSKK